MHKKTWEAAVQHRKTWVSYANQNAQPADRWEWVNITRLQSVVSVMEQQVPLTDAREQLEKMGYIGNDGYTIQRAKDKVMNFATDIGQDQSLLGGYIAHLVEWIANQVPVLDITPYCNQPNLLNKLLTPQMYLCARVDFHVEKHSTGQFEGIGRNHHVTLNFDFDQWNFTTSTSQHCWLGGERNFISCFWDRSGGSGRPT